MARVTRANVARGRWAEDLVARWYARQGYDVLDRNWRCAGGELDVVLARGDELVFCEVKARRTAAYGVPAEAVGPQKLLRLRRLAAAWMAAHHHLRPASGRTAWHVRIDVACVLGTRLEVIEGVG